MNLTPQKFDRTFLIYYLEIKNEEKENKRKKFFTNTHTKDFSIANFTIVKMNFHLQNTIVF